MKLAETVTFGGSGLDRAAHLRADKTALEAALSAETTRHLVMWRGKPLVVQPDLDRLAILPTGHPLLSACTGDQIFLGRDGEDAIFIRDLGNWWPEGLDASALGGFFDQTEQHHPTADDGHVFAELRGVMTRLSPRDAELAATARAMFEWHRRHGFCAACGQPSHMEHGGWQRGCEGCHATHFPRTDPVVIMLITHGNSVLLGRSPGWPEGMYSLLAGFVEPGETLEAAVRREVLEEAGITVGSVTYLASQPWPFPASLMMGCKGDATSDQIRIDPAELEDAIWVSREEVARAFMGQHPTIHPARKGSIAQFLLEHWLSDRLD
jgi:NAD+ diphosphatase